MRRQDRANIVNLPATLQSSDPTDLVEDTDTPPKFHISQEILSIVESNHNFDNLILNQRRFKGHPYLNLGKYLRDLNQESPPSPAKKTGHIAFKMCPKFSQTESQVSSTAQRLY